MSLALTPANCALLIIDVQERLAGVMPEPVRHQVERNVSILAAAAGRFALPVVASEQYPKGLGRTTPAVTAALEPVRGVCFFEKVEFAATDAPAWREAIGETPRPAWIVTGMETHVCVYQTVRALCAGGAAVHVVADAVASRTKLNWRTGLDLCARAGAVITTTEAVVFDLLGKAATDDFRALSRLIR